MIPKVGLMEVQTAELKKSNVASNALSLKCCDEEGDACCLSFRGSQAAPQKAEAKQGGLNWVKVGLASVVGAGLGYAYSKFAQPLANKKWAELGVEDLRNTLTTAVNKMSAKEYAKIRIPVEDIKYPLTLQDVENEVRTQIDEAKLTQGERDVEIKKIAEAKQAALLAKEAEHKAILGNAEVYLDKDIAEVNKAVDAAAHVAQIEKAPIEMTKEANKAAEVVKLLTQEKEKAIAETKEVLEKTVTEPFDAKIQKLDVVNELTKQLNIDSLNAKLQATNEMLKEEGSNAEKIAQTRRKNFVKYVKPEELAQYKAEFVESLKTMESKDLLALVNKMTSSKKGIMAVGAAVLGLGYIAYEKLVNKA